MMWMRSAGLSALIFCLSSLANGMGLADGEAGGDNLATAAESTGCSGGVAAKAPVDRIFDPELLIAAHRLAMGGAIFQYNVPALRRVIGDVDLRRIAVAWIEVKWTNARAADTTFRFLTNLGAARNQLGFDPQLPPTLADYLSAVIENIALVEAEYDPEADLALMEGTNHFFDTANGIDSSGAVGLYGYHAEVLFPGVRAFFRASKNQKFAAYLRE